MKGASNHLPEENTDSSDTDSSTLDSDAHTEQSDQSPDSDTDADIFIVEPSESQDPRAKILSVAGLEDLFLEKAAGLLSPIFFY